MAKYEIVYTEIKVKRFNSIKRMRVFVFGKRSPVKGILRVVEKKNGLLHQHNLLDWYKR